MHRWSTSDRARRLTAVPRSGPGATPESRPAALRGTPVSQGAMVTALWVHPATKVGSLHAGVDLSIGVHDSDNL